MSRICGARDRLGRVCDLSRGHRPTCRFSHRPSVDIVEPRHQPRRNDRPGSCWDEHCLRAVERLGRWAHGAEIAHALPVEADQRTILRDVLPRLAASGRLRRQAGGFYRLAAAVPV